MTRTRLHLAAGSGFLNDPTGMVRLDGRWHVYFQHSPDRGTTTSGGATPSATTC